MAISGKALAHSISHVIYNNNNNNNKAETNKNVDDRKLLFARKPLTSVACELSESKQILILTIIFYGFLTFFTFLFVYFHVISYKAVCYILCLSLFFKAHDMLYF